nr:hypothetical protein [Tanacetum cinerariifolium]
MSRDVLTVGSTMRILLLYRGEYSQWVERLMNYLEEQMDREAMINSIKNGDQPLPRVTQVSIIRTSSTKQPPLKDKSIWSNQEKKIQKIYRLARSLLIQGLPNDIYSLIDRKKTAKDLWDALARYMLGSKYGEQDRKAVVLYEYETFNATEAELLLDAYIRYLQVINDLKKCGYSKDNCKLNFKFLNSLQPEWKQYATMMGQNKNLMDINIDSLYNILKQNQGDVNDGMGLKKKIVVVTSDTLALITEKMKEGHFVKDCKKVKVKDYEYYKTKMLLAKKDKDEQVLLAEDQAWMESSSDLDQEINANMVFMAQIKKVLSDSEASSSSADDKISKVSYYLSKSKSDSEYETSEYYDNTTTYAKDLRPTLYDVRVIILGYTLMFLTHSDEALEIEKFKRARETKIEFAYEYGSMNASYVNEKINFLDDYFQEIINLDFDKIDSLFKQTSSLKPYVLTVILEKIIIDLEDEVVILLEKEKENLKTIESLKSKDVETGVESSENAIFKSENQSEMIVKWLKKNVTTWRI